MATMPTVAIIGRPNTGKSTLFNRLVGRRRAIVSDTPGTTRDHVAARIEGEAVNYLLVDTGGMGGGTDDEDFEDDVHTQSLLALENGDLIVFTVNSREILTSSDYEIVDLLRKNKKDHVPIVLVVTKCDNPLELDTVLPQFYELGIADAIIPISAPHNIGIEELQDEIDKQLSALHFSKPDNETKSANTLPHVAIVGKPNVGKSSIVNALMSETQRQSSPLLVSDVAGTTRDSTDTVITYHEKEYVFIDTAGIKRRKQTEKNIETFAYFRSIKALERADIAFLVLDATQEISKQDKRIARMILEEGKGLIILLNKTDKLSTADKKLFVAHVEVELNFCRFAPMIPCSAETREGLLKIFDLLEMAQANRTRHIPTNALNDWYRQVIGNQPVRSLASGKYITQAEEVPPTFVLFVKDPKKIQNSQLRFLENRIRETFAFEGTPIRWITKVG